MSKKLIIDWDTYNKSIDNLAIQISDSGFKPSFIICIARGGLRVGDILSRIFNVKCGYLGVESYSAEKNNQFADKQNELTFARDLSTTSRNYGENILVTDDLIDTGVTLEKTLKWLENYKDFKDKKIKYMSDEEAIEYLSDLRQIGRWSAEMILIFNLNRSNIWPIQDIGLLRAISNNYKKKYHPPKNFVNKLNKKFTPYCTVATWYLWRSIDDEPIQY